MLTLLRLPGEASWGAPHASLPGTCPERHHKAARPHRLMEGKLTIMSAMKRPTMPKTPPLAPTSARHVSSNAALKRLPGVQGHAQEPFLPCETRFP